MRIPSRYAYVRKSTEEIQMFKQTLISALLALSLVGAANAQEEVPDPYAVAGHMPEIAERMPSQMPPFATPIPVPESMLAAAGGSGQTCAVVSTEFELEGCIGSGQIHAADDFPWPMP
jgi:hypothetical protein